MTECRDAKSTVAATVLLAASSAPAHAGSIAAINAIFMAFYIYCGVAVALALLALFLCRFVRDRMVRALVRLAIVVLVAAPVPSVGVYGTSSIAPAFIAAVQYLNLAGANPKQGLFAFAMPIAYLVSFAAFTPLVVAWVRLGEPYDRR